VPAFVASPLHGSGKNRRSYLYVDDVCRAFRLILLKGVVGTMTPYLLRSLSLQWTPHFAGEIYNIGSNKEHSNVEVLGCLLKLFGLQDQAKKVGAHCCAPSVLAGLRCLHSAFDSACPRCLSCLQYTVFVKDRSYNDLRYLIDSSNLEKVPLVPQLLHWVPSFACFSLCVCLEAWVAARSRLRQGPGENKCVPWLCPINCRPLLPALLRCVRSFA
jgi:dTDP-D-glucose 4,6-dehydratase